MVPGLRVESVTVARGPYELRVHRVVGAPPGARLTHTGWATGPEEPLVSALHGLHGWDGEPETVRAPQGTAYTAWAELPRLSGTAGGTSLHVCLAALSGEPGPGPSPRPSPRWCPVRRASRWSGRTAAGAPASPSTPSG